MKEYNAIILQGGKLQALIMPEKIEYCFTFSKGYPCDGNGCLEAIKAGYCLCYENYDDIEKAKAEAIDFRPEDYSQFVTGGVYSLMFEVSSGIFCAIAFKIKEGEIYPRPDGFRIEIEPYRSRAEEDSNRYYAKLVPIKEQSPTERFYKLTMRWGGGEKELSVDYYNDLTKMIDEVFHFGVTGLPVIEKCEEVSKDEYEENHLPI